MRANLLEREWWSAMKTSAHSAALLAENPEDGHSLNPVREPSLGPEIQAQLGELLRGMYGELLSRPIPDRLLDLLDRLDREAGENQS